MVVTIASIGNNNNVGDEIIGTVPEWLIKAHSEKIEIKKIEFSPERKYLIKKSPVLLLLSKIVYKIGTLFSNRVSQYKVINLSYKIRNSLYYKKALKDTDALIIAVGMLKFKTQAHSFLFDNLIQQAYAKKIPVMINAVSIANPDINDWRFHQLKTAVNNPSVKVITTRDGVSGLELLNKEYKNKSLITDYVGDTALWIPEVYSIKKNPSKHCIGVNLIRSDIYIDYDGNITEKQLFDFYKELIQKLLAENEPFSLFCNGLESDYSLGLKLIKELNLPSDFLLPNPHCAEDYFSILQRFDVVLGARFHACLCCYALDIPAVGLLWDGKLRKFSEFTNRQEYFLEEDQLNGDTVFSIISKCRNSKYDELSRNNLKIKTKFYIDEFIDYLSSENHRDLS